MSTHAWLGEVDNSLEKEPNKSELINSTSLSIQVLNGIMNQSQTPKSNSENEQSFFKTKQNLTIQTY